MDYHPIHFLVCFIYFLLNFLFLYFASTNYKELALLPFHYLNHVNLLYKTSYQFPSVPVRLRSHRLTSRTTVGSESLALTLTVSRLASLISLLALFRSRLASPRSRIVPASLSSQTKFHSRLPRLASLRSPRLAYIPASALPFRFVTSVPHFSRSPGTELPRLCSL